MKLIETSDAAPILEDDASAKLADGVLARVTYNICNLGELNANNRVYEREVWDKVLADEKLREKRENRALLGQAEHPDSTASDLQLTSHIITDMWIDESANKVFQRMEILDTPTGRILETMLKAGCKIGVSTRAEGDLEDFELEEADGNKKSCQRVIADTYNYCTTDFTADPSTFNTIPKNVEHNVIEIVSSLLKKDKMNLQEKQFATCLLESIRCKECKCGDACKVQKLVNELKVKKDTQSLSVGDKAQGSFGHLVGKKYQKFNYKAKILSADESGAIISVNGVKLDVSSDNWEANREGALEDIVANELENLEAQGQWPFSASNEKVKEGWEEETAKAGVSPDMVAKAEELLKKGKSPDDMVKAILDDPIDAEWFRDEFLGNEFDLQHELEELIDIKQEQGDRADIDLDKSEAVLSEMELPTEGGVSPKVAVGNLLRGPEDKYYVVFFADNQGLKVESTDDGGVGAAPLVSWDVAKEQGYVKVAEAVKVEESENIKAMYKGTGLPVPGGKGIHTKAFHKLAIEVAKGYLDDKGPEEAMRLGYATAMDRLGKEKAVKKSHRSNESEVDEDVRQVRPGTYSVLFYDGHKEDVEAESKVAAMKTVRERHPESKVSNISLLKQTGKRRDIYSEFKVLNRMIDARITEASLKAELAVCTEKLSECRDASIATKIVQSRLSEASKQLEKATKQLAEISQQLVEKKEESLAIRAILEKKAKALVEQKQVTQVTTEKLEESTAELKELTSKYNALNEEHQKELTSKYNALNEEHQKELVDTATNSLAEGRKQVIDEYFAQETNSRNLQIDENSRALLEGCQTLHEVDSLMERLVDVARRSALHSKPLTKVQVQEARVVDPEQDRVDQTVGLMFERFVK